MKKLSILICLIALLFTTSCGPSGRATSQQGTIHVRTVQITLRLPEDPETEWVLGPDQFQIDPLTNGLIVLTVRRSTALGPSLTRAFGRYVVASREEADQTGHKWRTSYGLLACREVGSDPGNANVETARFNWALGGWFDSAAQAAAQLPNETDASFVGLPETSEQPTKPLTNQEAVRFLRDHSLAGVICRGPHTARLLTARSQHLPGGETTLDEWDAWLRLEGGEQLLVFKAGQTTHFYAIGDEGRLVGLDTRMNPGHVAIYHRRSTSPTGSIYDQAYFTDAGVDSQGKVDLDFSTPERDYPIGVVAHSTVRADGTQILAVRYPSPSGLATNDEVPLLIEGRRWPTVVTQVSNIDEWTQLVEFKLRPLPAKGTQVRVATDAD